MFFCFSKLSYIWDTFLQRHWYHPHAQTYLRNLDSCLESKAKWSYCASHRLADAFLRAWSPFRLIASFCYGTSVRLYPSNWISICMQSAPQNHGPAYTFGCVVLHRRGGGGKGGNWNLYGDSSWSALASDLNCLRTLLGSAMCWSFLRCTRHWVSETNHSSFPSDSLQSANVQKKNIARMRPAILQWFQSILFCLASPAGAAAPCRSRGHVWPVTTSTRLKRSASVLPQMLGFNLGSGAFRDWSLGLPN